MYTGSIELNIEDKHDYFDLVKAANELALIELVEYIQEYMIQNEKPWMLENFVQLFQKISTYDSMHKLQTYCADLTAESFIFSFNKENKNSVISRVRNISCAIRDTRSRHFLGWGCGDLHILEGTCHRRDYEREIVGFHNFTIDDFEVFQVLDIIKKSK
nr:8276_t:CDS:2 [Entrophospora candida]